MDRCIPLCALLLSVLLIPAANAVVVNITVQDDADGSLLADASVYSNGEFIGKTGTTGFLPYTHYNNESYLLKVTKSGYAEWSTMVSITETSIVAELSKKSETVTVTLYDADTLQPVQNAMVFLRGENFSASDQSDANGKVIFRVETVQTYSIEVRASRYEILQKTFDMDASAKEVQYWLFRSDQFVIRVLDASSMTPISNASITVDSVRSGYTDADGRVTLHLDRERKYVIGVEKSDYQPYSKEIIISSEDALHTALLSKSTYPVFISVFDEHLSPVQGADVLLNDTYLGKTDQYGRISLSNLEAGSHMLEVRRSGFVTWKSVKEISKTGEDIVVELAYGSCNVSIIVENADRKKLAGAMVMVDGMEIGSTDSGGTIENKLKTGAQYNVSASLDGYRQAFDKKDVPLGASNLTITIQLERSTDYTIIITAFAGIAALGIALMGARRFFGGRRDHKHRKR